MIADCAFFTGSTHAVCEDYARHGMAGQFPYVLMADGCSSSADSDIGARLLVLAAKEFVGDIDCDITTYHSNVIARAAAYAKELKLPVNCLDATLMTIKIEHGVPMALVYGDGYVATGKNGSISLTKISYPQNVPNYMSYQLGTRGVKFKLPPALVENYLIQPTGWSLVGTEALATDFYCKFVDQECDFVAVMSDGAGSFLRPVHSETSKTNEAVPMDQIIPDLLNFKTFQPGFVQRRLKRLTKEIRDKNWQHYDDLSVGALALHPEAKDVLPVQAT